MTIQQDYTQEDKLFDALRRCPYSVLVDQLGSIHIHHNSVVWWETIRDVPWYKKLLPFYKIKTNTLADRIPTYYCRKIEDEGWTKEEYIQEVVKEVRGEIEEYLRIFRLRCAVFVIGYILTVILGSLFFHIIIAAPASNSILAGFSLSALFFHVYPYILQKLNLHKKIY